MMMMQQLTLDQVQSRLGEFLGDAMVEMEMLYDMLTVTVDKEKVFDTIAF
jgi:hypothetical protein